MFPCTLWLYFIDIGIYVESTFLNLGQLIELLYLVIFLHFSYPTLLLLLLIIFMKMVVLTHKHIQMHIKGSCEIQTLKYKLVEELLIWDFGCQLSFHASTHHGMTMDMYGIHVKRLLSCTLTWKCLTR